MTKLEAMYRAILGCALLLVAANALAYERIVIAGNAMSELVFALGASDQVVAMDKTSNFNEIAAKRAVLGHPRNLSVEGILAQQPDLVLSSAENGPAQVFEKIKAVGTNTIIMDEVVDEQGLYQRVEKVAALLGKEQEGRELIVHLKQKKSEITAKLAKITVKKRVLFLAGKHALMIEGKGTSVDLLIRLAGGINAAQNIDGKKTITPEALILARPDTIATVSKALKGKGEKGLQRFFSIPAIKASNAGKARSIFSIENAEMHIGIHYLDTVEKIYRHLYQS